MVSSQMFKSISKLIALSNHKDNLIFSFFVSKIEYICLRKVGKDMLLYHLRIQIETLAIVYFETS